jgi:hypothetical protein
LLFLLFFAAKYQSSFHLVRSPAPAIGAPREHMEHEDYGTFIVADLAPIKIERNHGSGPRRVNIKLGRKPELTQPRGGRPIAA